MVRAKKKSGGGATTFVCQPGPDAREVFLAGDFNEWDPTATRMVKRKGAFRRNMELASGDHQYKFVVDGDWVTDPSAKVQVPDGLGNTNSVVRV